MTNVAALWTAFPDAARAKAGTLRDWIAEEAVRCGVGPIAASVKWGQASFAAQGHKRGTPIRVHWSDKKPDQLQLLVHCQTQLVDRWRQDAPTLSFEGNRAVLLPLDAPLPEAELRHCIATALTYAKVSS